MRFKRWLFLISSMVFVGGVFAQGWAPYTGTEDSFRIHVPCVFEVQTIDYPSEYGAEFPARVYACENDGSTFKMTVVDYTDARRIHSERSRTEADYELYWEVDIRASIAYAAWNIRKRGGEVTYDAYHYIDRVEGHQLQITNDDQSRTFAAIYLHDSRLYISEATVPPGAVPPGFFQQSLEWIDEEGNRIRYENYSDAPKVRNPEIR